MKVSVSITTYQHKDFIANALESALGQVTNFDYEILVGEDCSTDGTREIVREYQERYPDKLRVFYHERGINDNGNEAMGFASARKNFINNMREAQGEYVALLDGDDYWTDPYKLQKQVDFLDTHQECSICFMAARAVNNDGSCNLFVMGPQNGQGCFDLQSILDANPFCAATTMYRNNLWDEFPDWFHKMPGVFWPLIVLCAMHGKIGYLDQVAADYRMHDRAVHSSLRSLEKLKLIIHEREILAPYLNPQQNVWLRHGIDRALRQMAELCRQEGLAYEVRSYSRRRISVSGVWGKRSLRENLRLYYMSLYSNKLDSFLRSCLLRG